MGEVNAMKTVIFLALMIATPLVASGQGLDLTSPGPDRSRELDEQASRRIVPDADLQPHRPAVPHSPGFITPLTRQTRDGRYGVAGWTSPNTRVGSRGAADPDNAGWFSFGFAYEWGASPRPGRN
jgi:hypothetical protein